MSTIKSSAENLTLNADGANNDIKFQSNGSEVASIDQAGLVTATSFAGSGANLTGISSVGGATGVDFNDSVKARFGTGNDLEIYHDATDSYVKDNGTGNLLLQGTNLNLQSTAAENYIRCTADAQVELYHNNAKKIETTANGASVTGKVLASGGIGTGGIQSSYTNTFGGSNSVGEFLSSHAYKASTSLRYAASASSNGTVAFYMGTHASMAGGSSTDVSTGIYVQNSQPFRIGHGTATTVQVQPNKLVLFYASANNWNQQCFAGSTGSQSFIDFRLSNNSQVGYIVTNGSSTTYATSSDHRLKENVVDMTDATTRLKQLQPKQFNFIADDTNTLVDGFIAHEAATVVPEAVTGTHNETEVVNNVVLNADGSVNKQDVTEADWTEGKSATTDPQGNEVAALYASDTTWVATKTVPKYQGIDQSKLVPLLVKTIQELEARITALEA